MQQTPIAPEPSRSALRRLAQHLGLRFVTLDPSRADEPDYCAVSPLAASLVPEAVCRARRALPIAYRDGIVTVATPDPFADLSDLLGRPVEVVATAPSDLEAALTAAFGGPPPQIKPSGERLGERLVARGTAGADQVQAALRRQQREGGRIGELLVHAGACDERAVAQALAEQLDRPFCDAAEVEPEPHAIGLVPEPLTRRLRIVPLSAGPDWIDVATADALSERDCHELVTATRGRAVRQHVAPAAALEGLLRRVHSPAHASAARMGLYTRFPGESAARVLTAPQQRLGALVLLLALAGMLVAPRATAEVLLGAGVVVIVAVTAFRLALAFAMLGRSEGVAISGGELAALDDRDLPVYTVLVPLLREAAVLPRLLVALDALDYPRHRLDVRLLVEADDAETLTAVRRVSLGAHMTVVEVPPGLPRTKPRALAYGLLFARGEHVVVYDAEDRPAPDQLRLAVAAFARCGPRIACVQARLGCFNGHCGLLERWFAADYAVQFDLLLPALARRGWPVPLGGTSNHFLTERLVEVGGWDPFNVTEDADLGVRLHKAGLRTAILDSTTLEEAPGELGNWVRQRSRWSKGHLQTLLVHLRHPARLVQRLGPGGAVAFLGIVGSVVVSLLAAPFWLLTTLWFLTGPSWLSDVFGPAIFHLAVLGALVGTVGAVLLAVAGALQRGEFAAVRYALLSPLGWGLISVAAWRGLVQLPARAHEWEKTEHGLAAEGPR